MKYDSYIMVKGECQYEDRGLYLGVPEMGGNVISNIAELESKDLVHDIKASDSLTIQHHRD